MITKLIFALALLLVSAAADECVAPECSVYAPQPGFDVRKLPCCYLKDFESEPLKGGNRDSCNVEWEKCETLCSAYLTPKPIACGPYTLLEEIPNLLVNYLNARNFLGLSTLYDAFGYRASFGGDAPYETIQGACEVIELYSSIPSVQNGLFSVEEIFSLYDNGNIASIIVAFSFQSEPFSFGWVTNMVLTRDACNNWVISLENVFSEPPVTL